MNYGPLPEQLGFLERDLLELARLLSLERLRIAGDSDSHYREKLRRIRDLADQMPILILEAEIEACEHCRGTGFLCSGHPNDPASHSPCPECELRQIEIERITETGCARDNGCGETPCICTLP